MKTLDQFLDESMGGGVPLTPQELEIQKKMSRLNVRLARKRSQQMQKAKIDDTDYTVVFEPEPDVRWNKIKLLIHLLKIAKTNKEEKEGGRLWYLWMDADLVFLDENFL